MGDHHVHLHRHGPAPEGVDLNKLPDGHIEAYVETALRRGADEVGFTEHLYRCFESEDLLGEFWSGARDELAQQAAGFVKEDRILSLDAYVGAVVAAKDAGLPVKLGLEVDYFPESIERVCAYLADYPFDFLIGSVHWVGGWSIDHDDAVQEFERRGVQQSYDDYFELERDLAASGAVDVLAHADVVKKFGHRAAADHHYDAVATAAAASGTAIEVSTAGLYKPVREMYPAPAFLERCYSAGVAITLASDAHEPADAARDRDKAIAAARRAGYNQRVRFDARVGQMVPLD